MPRKRIKFRRSRLNNLAQARTCNPKNQSPMLGKSLSETVGCDQPERVIKRRKIARGEPKTRVYPERKCNVPKSYVDDVVQRGTDGGYKKSLRSVRGIVSSRAQWRHYNEEKKRASHKKTLERQSDRLEIVKLAYAKLSEVS